MRKVVVILALILMITPPSYAVNIFDQLLYKEVVLVANRMTVLVNRITGKAKYIRLNNGRWMLLKGGLKNKCQAMYDVQISPQPVLIPVSR
ncbi:MAG: hypothetical protein KJ710_01725 [Candidatus Omnitrophica bacterium]|nr:hypothetical protein [Candidatus Omnitrophota bacterium]MBU1922970.1 hypothetical protein [Candidatus Omnitrophota bacterium]